MLYEIIYFLWGSSQLNERKKRRKSTVVCTKCEAEWPLGTKFCGKCGNKQLVSVPEFEKLEDARYKMRQHENATVLQRNLARQRISVLKTATYCPSCSIYFDPALSFCSQCGTDVSSHKLPDNDLFQIVQPEFPQVVRSFGDYQTLSQTKQEGVGGIAEVANDIYRWWRR